MSQDDQPTRPDTTRGYQPHQDFHDLADNGYQPETGGAADISSVTPPVGGTAIEAPQSSTQADQSK